MIVWLLREFEPFSHRLAAASTGDSRVYLALRVAVAGATAFVAALVLGRPAIRWLGGRFRERVASASGRLDALHAGKNRTPTMGGLFLVAAVVVATLVCGDLTNRGVLLALFVAVTFGLIGGVDDWVKLSTARRGLTARQKFLAQVAAAGVAALILLRDRPETSVGVGVALVLWAVLVIVGSSNAVNLTDGLDGLASGCTVFAASALAGLSYLAGHAVWAGYLDVTFVPGAGEMAVVLAALVGAMLGFLWFNCYPAQVFMGDIGSLPAGALLGLAALVCRQELLLVVAGGVFVVETLSVIAQVSSYRLTGRRLLACSPLHNHFVLRGEHELKVVVRFWIGSAVLAVLAIASLKVR